MKTVKTALKACALLACMATAHTAEAQISMGSFGNWQNALPGNTTCLNYSAAAATNPGDTHSVNWGQGAFTTVTCAEQSGYDFTGIAMTSYTPSGLIDIGDFVHRNQPIMGNVLTNAQLNLQIRLDDGLGPQTVGAVIDFTHDETPNGASPCPYTPNNAAGECSDLVSFPVSFTAPVVLNGTSYVLQVVGFSIDGGASFTNNFVTLENSVNKADIFARLVTSGADCPPDCGQLPVPTPLPLLLMGGGLIALHRKWRTRIE